MMKTLHRLLKSPGLLVLVCGLAGAQALSRGVIASALASELQASTPPPIYLPLVMNNYWSLPAASISRYMGTINSTTLYNEGCSQGAVSPGDSVVVLDFGQPWYQNSSYGSLLLGVQVFASVSQIQSAAESFLTGYWDCSPASAHLTLGIGTSNYGYYVGAGHGQAWAQMVGRVDSWLKAPPNYAVKEMVVGANDIELSWNTPAISRAWVDAYAAVNARPYYDYGSCDSCPFFKCPNCTPSNGWSTDDIWYVTWGSKPAWPLPEIYRTDGGNADQWYRMSVYAYNAHALRMGMVGSLTQWQACQDRGGCTGVNNTPKAGYTQLYNALNADPRTAQSLEWSTDITWQN